MLYTSQGTTITINLERDELLSEAGVATLKDRYLLENETSPQECFARSACAFGSNQEHAQRLYDYASKCWFMFSTPILSNAGTKRGLPISCFLSIVDDSMEGILEHHMESGYLASFGGGVGTDWSSLRCGGSSTSRGNTSSGLIPFVKMADTQMLAVQQGATRRGAYAAYLDISHPEIEEFISLRTATGSDVSRRCLGTGFHHGVNIPDTFMEAVKEGKQWDLVDPHTKVVKKAVDARSLWMDLLIKRLETGEPYLFFTDTANSKLPDWLRGRGELRINASNLCTEIMLPTSSERTAVCCLSSVNLEYYDDWKDNKQFIFDIMECLDNVLEYFIANAPKSMWRAVNSARSERSVGLGTMGFALYLQRKGIPFESPAAIGVNRSIFKHIKEKTDHANKTLGALRGPAPDAMASGLRFSHSMAIAPTASISLICGNTSPSIEPYNANAFKQSTMSGSFLIKNKELDRHIKEHFSFGSLEGFADKEGYDKMWSDITVNGGSIQHTDLPRTIKELFKTAFELDQNWIIEHAGHRQEFIDQGQSVNLFLAPDVHKNELHKLHFSAWQKGLKSLYYLRSKAAKKIQKATIDVVAYDEEKECVACQ